MEHNDFDVTILSNNEIRIYNYRQNVNYYLIGYQYKSILIMINYFMKTLNTFYKNI